MSYKDFLNSKVFNPGYYSVRMVLHYLIERFNENGALDYTPYSDDMKKSDAFFSVLITTKYDWETKFRSKRPAIFVSRGNMMSSLNGTGVGKMLSVTENGDVTTYLDVVTFPLVIECIAESDVESEALSSMVAAFLAMDARPLRSLGLQIQGGLTQTPPQLYEKNNTSFISSVILQVQSERRFTARRMGDKLLDKIKFSIVQNSSVISSEVSEKD